MVAGVAARVGPEEEKALAELVEVAVKLKESGLLGWLKAFTENADKLLALAVADETLARGLGLGHAVAEGLREPKPQEVIDAKRSVSELVSCTVKALAAAEPAKARPVGGLLGLMRALGDEDVKKGLGALIALAKHLGACLREKEGRG